MKFQAVKGTRDFYPDDMRLRNYITDAWRRVSLRNGFEEYDAPIFEYLDLFTIKSGQEIASQLFSFTDRGGRNLAIRPEVTPSLARMIAAKISALPRPIKWFSLPRLCRAENPQRGRLREFFQWNIDVVGVEGVQADVECIFTLVDFLREVGLTPTDIQVRVGSRPSVTAMLREQGVMEDRMEQALLALDKRPKSTPDAFRKTMAELGVSPNTTKKIESFLDVSPDKAISQLLTTTASPEHVEDIQKLWDHLGAMGVREYTTFDWHIVRGLAYYTGIVYEAIAEGERAVAGGGRYDNLLQLVGGPEVSATGFGMGDVVLGLLLEEKGKIPPEARTGGLDLFVIAEADEDFATALRIAAAARARGVAADYSFKRQGVGKQLKEANRRRAKRAAIVRDEAVAVKDLKTGQQGAPEPVERFLESLQVSAGG